MSLNNPNIDFMAIGAHADDVELWAGGTLLKLNKMEKKGAIVDLTDAAASTRGSPELRLKEAKDAARVLGVTGRENLEMPDGGLQNSWEFQKPVVEAIRRLRPHILLTHYPEDENPDHAAAGGIVKSAWYKAGLRKIKCEGRPVRPRRIFYFLGMVYIEPKFCVDISEFWDQKMEAILCYRSQFYGEHYQDFKGKTEIATPEFLENLQVRHRFFGTRIKRKYAEPFYCSEIPEVEDLTSCGGARF